MLPDLSSSLLIEPLLEFPPVEPELDPLDELDPAEDEPVVEEPPCPAAAD